MVKYIHRCGRGGIGRLGGFRFLCESVQVRVQSPAPLEKGRLRPSFFCWYGNRTRTHLNPDVRWTSGATSSKTGGILTFAQSANGNRVLSPAPIEKGRLRSSFFCWYGNRTRTHLNPDVRWTVPGFRLDGNHSLISSSPVICTGLRVNNAIT